MIYKLSNLKSEKRGFFSIDGLFAMILLLLVIGTFVSIYQGRAEMVEDAEIRLKGEMIGQKLAGSINTVYATGEPLTLNVDLPDNITGDEYTVEYLKENRKILIELKGKTGKINLAESDVIPENLDVQDLNSSKKVRIHWENSRIKVKNQ